MKHIRRLIPARIPLVNRRPIHQKRIILHSPRLIEIILAPCTVQLRRPLVPIHPDHIIALAPPRPLKIRHRQIASNIVSDPCRLQNRVIAIPRLPLNIANIRLWRIHANFVPPTIAGIFPVKLRVKIRRIFAPRIVVQLVIHVKILSIRLIALIRHLNARRNIKRHKQITIQRGIGHKLILALCIGRRRKRQRLKRRGNTVPQTKEISQRHLDTRIVFTIPKHL